MSIFLPALICLTVTLVVPVLWVPMLRCWGAVDVPNFRSSHLVPTIRGAGLAPLTGVLSGALAALLAPGSIDSIRAAAVVGLAALVAVLGLVEDLKGLPVQVRASGQLVLGLVAASLLVGLTSSPWWLVVPGALAVAGYVNAANFMDGVDGMSALHGLVAGTYFAVVGVVIVQPWVAVLGGLTAAAFVGFAPWNLLRARVFLGDVGSYLLGAMVVMTGIAVLLSGATLLLAAAPALPYLADTGFTLATRARRRERLLESHRGHVYQQLTDRGWSHPASAGLVALASVMCSVAALWGFLEGQRLAPLALVLLVLLAYLLAPRWPALRVREVA